MKSVKVQIWSQVEDQFWNPVFEQVELANLSNRVWSQVERSVSGQVLDQVWKQVDNRP